VQGDSGQGPAQAASSGRPLAAGRRLSEIGTRFRRPPVLGGDGGRPLKGEAVTKQREQSVVRVALHEIQRLLSTRGQGGSQIDGWVQQMAAELCSAVPELDPDAAANIAHRMLEEPRQSMDAQSRLDMASLVALKR